MKLNWQKIKRLIGKFGCDHEYKFVRNLYGDQINLYGGKRSVWECTKCGHIQFREDLYEVCNLGKELRKIYNEYFERRWKEWKELRSEILNEMTETMRELAYTGHMSTDFAILCEVAHDDKRRYERWFQENGLYCETKLYGQKEECTEVNNYKFHVWWN